MKRIIVGVMVLAVAAVALRRFGPAVGERAMAKCAEMMAKHRGDVGAEFSDPVRTSKDPGTPAAA